MARFLIERLLQSIAILLLVSFLTYMLIGLMPGDPIDIMLLSDPELTASDAARLKAQYGLDRPLPVRYGIWLAALLQGDLGYSRLFTQPVEAVLIPRLVNTLALLLPALAIALVIAVPLGIRMARHPGGILDRTVGAFCFASISMPPFWLALLLILIFSIGLNMLPSGGVGQDEGWIERLRFMVLPIATLILLNIGGYIRHMRAAMLDVLRQDYIRTARAKGAGERHIVYVHALRNALPPMVTILALEFGTLFGGALVTETMFAYPGMGKLIYDSVLGNDFNVALCGILLVTLAVLVGNLVADLIYALLDPRIGMRLENGA